MAHIQVVSVEDTEFINVDDYVVALKDELDGSGEAASISEAVPTGGDRRPGAIRMLVPGSATELQLFEIELPPGHLIESHAHRASEIVYVTQGTLMLGARSCGVGSAVFIPAYTLYALRAGPDGLRFLNFRARMDFSNISKDEYRGVMASRRNSLDEEPEGSGETNRSISPR